MFLISTLDYLSLSLSLLPVQYFCSLLLFVDYRFLKHFIQLASTESPLYAFLYINSCLTLFLISSSKQSRDLSKRKNACILEVRRQQNSCQSLTHAGPCSYLYGIFLRSDGITTVTCSSYLIIAMRPTTACPGKNKQSKTNKGINFKLQFMEILHNPKPLFPSLNVKGETSVNIFLCLLKMVYWLCILNNYSETRRNVFLCANIPVTNQSWVSLVPVRMRHKQ